MGRHTPKPKPRPKPKPKLYKSLGIFSKEELRFEDRTGIILHDGTKSMLDPNSQLSLRLPPQFIKTIKKDYIEVE